MPGARYKGPLTIEAETEDTPVQRQGTDLTQFIERLQQSKQTGQTYGMNIPAAAESLFDSRFRAAARKIDYGVRIQFIKYGTMEAAPYNLRPDQSRCKYQATERKQMAPRQPKDTNGQPPAKKAASNLPGKK